MRTDITALFWLSLSILISGCTLQAEEQAAPEAKIRPAKIFIAQAAGAPVKRVYPGTVEASRKSDLAFRVGGQLKALPAQPGLNVKQGDLLAQLDDTDFRNTLAEYQAKYKLAKTQYNQTKKLFDKKYTAQANVDKASAELKAARAALAQAQDNLKYTHLNAPFAGVIAHVSIENYQAVKAQTPVLQLRSDDSLDVRFSVPETLLAELKKVEDPSGICVTVSFNAHPDKNYRACFKEFESVPDPLTRTYSVVHTMPQIEDFAVLPGMAVNVEVNLSGLLLEPVQTGVLVPLAAVFEQEGKTWVWKVKKDMQVHRSEVQIGAVSKGHLRVLSGLQAGEPVIAAGVTYLREGMQVRALVKERGL
ncbi:efflux RND transporter periplasmic adaptor subunit [Candidatus Venteria ishoeyi]|uniref:efflux RND transporter periplasmic adaptor subunit n=2 Tax=Candidatus Venteria ishoeyi TaxID=1899563 RepID=UPI0025A4E991|nr:efflux RND transporter periplasmic adaptor subunit [Candidatus Venteria ishoeyi]MDM8547816.1 efflux RND transporter periplasmic adaptor subunit [Candidatus Venteria ishoeyi]